MPREMLITVKKLIKGALKWKLLVFFSLWLLFTPWSRVFAQGSITGTVNNSDMGIPADSEVTFWGFLDDTDEEIRTELSDGAGYQNGNWWDDFQNYGTEAAGNPYDYLFSNLINGEFYHLEGLIPNNSYQEENIVLASGSNPSKPTGVKARVTSTSRVVVSWNKVAGITYHVYRRYTSSNGSLFRLDDTGGSLANPGVSDSFFVDNTVDGINSYTYMVIGEDASGNYAPHSDEASANSSVPTAPVVLSISPDTGPTAGGTFVTIKGENFDENGVTVTIGENTASNVVVNSPFELTCLTPAGSAGSVDVVVTNTASGLVSSPLVGGFTYYVNTPPVADAGPNQLGIIAGTLVTLDGSGSYDTDGDPLSYHWSQISGPGVVLSDSNIVNPTFTPDTGGTYYFQLYVDDAIAYSQPDTVMITVENQAPVLDPIGPRVMDEGDTLEFRVHATDPDGDSIILTAQNTPMNSSFVDSGNGAGSFTFTPDYTQSGIYNVTFIASDGSLADSEVVEITVNNVNQPPELASIGPKSVTEGDTLSFRVSATDPDGTTPTLSASPLPTNAAFVDSGNGAGSFTFTPDFTQSGSYPITFVASDGVLADSEVVTVTVNEVGNQAPDLVDQPDTTIVEGQNLTFTLSATDPDLDNISYSSPDLPTGATLNSTTGVFDWTPDYTQAGVDTVTFVATDDGSPVLADTELTVLTVNEVGNQAPDLTDQADTTIVEGQNLTFTLSATDPDLDNISYSSPDLPTGATLNSTTGVFDWTPDYTQAGVDTVTFVATDDGSPVLADTELTVLTVNEVGNQAPDLADQPDTSIVEGQYLTFTLVATDPDRDSISYSSPDLPTGATLDGATGVFEWTPDYTQGGVDTVTFVATDDGSPVLADTELTVLTVNEVGNQAPELASIGPKSVTEGDTLSFRVSATDPDGTTPSLSAEDLPPTNATFVDSGNGAGSFVFTPDYTQSGSYNVTFIASDGSLADSELVAITVNEAGNHRPDLADQPDTTILEGQNLTFTLQTTDLDLDSITYSSPDLPTGASLDSVSGTFDWTPDYNQAGAYVVTFIATDNGSPALADTESIQITVVESGANHPPIFISTPDSVSVSEAETLIVSITASDPDGNSVVLTSGPLPVHSFFTDQGGGVGEFTFTPDYYQAGVDTVTFYATDDGTPPMSGTHNLVITVVDVNLAPDVLPIDDQTVPEGQTLTFTVVATDSTSPSGSQGLVLTASGVPTNASFADSGNGRGGFSFTPDYSQAGEVDTVTFVCMDNGSPPLSSYEKVVITVTESNRPPYFVSCPDWKAMWEGDTVSFTVVAADSDGDSLVLVALDQENPGHELPPNSSFTDNGDGTADFVFTPDFTQSAIYSIAFKVSDGYSVVKKTVPIQVNETGNHNPVLDPIFAPAVMEGETLTFAVSGYDPDKDPVTLSVIDTLPPNATFTDSGNGLGSFVFSPDFTQSGSYPLTFVITDSSSAADSQLVTILVTEAGNQPPVLDSIGTQSVVEGDTLAFTITASDPEGDSLSLSAGNLPQNANFVDNGDGTGDFTFTPDFTQSGQYAVTFKAIDDSAAADSELVQITVVEAGNHPPVLGHIDNWAIYEAETLNVSITATDVDEDSITLSAANQPQNSTFTDNGDGTGDFLFIPDYDQAGIYNITFIASDGVLADSAVMRVTVVNVNRPPVIDSVSPQTVAEGDSLDLLVHATDPDADRFSFAAEQLLPNSSFTDHGNGSGSFIFEPDYMQAGSDTVVFICTDEGSPPLADTEVVVITVTDVNQPPSFVPIPPQSIFVGDTLRFSMVATDSTDPVGPNLALTVLDTLDHSAFVDSGGGIGGYEFAPDSNQVGTDTVRFVCTDGGSPPLADTLEVVIDIRAVNHPPVLDPIGPRTVTEGDTISFTVTASDPDGDSLTLSVGPLPSNATFTDNGDGTGDFLFTPDYTKSGTYEILFIASDGAVATSGRALATTSKLITIGGDMMGIGDFKQDEALADSELVTIDVLEAGNQQPVLDSVGSQTVAEGDSLSILVSASDPDNEFPSLSAEDLPPNCTFEDYGDGTGMFVFKPDFMQAGIDTVLFICADDSVPSLADTEVVVVTVTDVNQPPSFVPISPQTVLIGDTLNFIVVATDSTDPHGPNLTLMVLDTLNHSTVVDSGGGMGGYEFAPDSNQVRTDTVRFVCTDGGSTPLADTLEVVIQVNLETGSDMDELSGKIPKVFALHQNYPNPFNALTVVRYDLPADCWVKIEVYDILGRRVATLVDGLEKVGFKRMSWEAGSLASGVYFYRIEAGKFDAVRKMVLLK